MKLATLIAAVLALVAVPALAQTDPCAPAVTPPVSFTFDAGQVSLDVCYSDKDVSGAPALPKEWALITDGVRGVITLAKVQTTALPSGFFVYRGVVAFAKGIHAVDLEVLVDDGIGGLRATRLGSPFESKARGAAASSPVKPRLSPLP